MSDDRFLNLVTRMRACDWDAFDVLLASSSKEDMVDDVVHDDLLSVALRLGHLEALDRLLPLHFPKNHTSALGKTIPERFVKYASKVLPSGNVLVNSAADGFSPAPPREVLVLLLSKGVSFRGSDEGVSLLEFAKSFSLDGLVPLVEMALFNWRGDAFVARGHV